MEDAGAVALIGNTATTYLNFSVAMVTGNQNPFNEFSPYEKGLFDAMMHPDYISIGQVLTEVKVAADRVTGMGDELITWHNYAMNLLGDPSLSFYIGIPQEMNATYQLYPGSNTLITVQAVPNAYFAVTDENGIILGSDFTGNDGSGFLNLDPITTDNITLCITAKNMIPFLEEIAVTRPENNEISTNIVSLTNFPNPFNPATTIQLSIEQNEQYEFFIYNLKGQKVKDISPSLCHPELVEGRGKTSVIWNGTDSNNKPVSSGIYYAVLKQNGSQLACHKMILIK
jgi:Peptidase family C25, C terminal ig-like domain